MGRGEGPIRFRFDERKAAGAASLLLEQAGGSMEYLRLLKLLYFAERESLDTLGRPILGDRYFAMKNGPVLSQVYDLIKQTIAETLPSGPWAEHFERAGRYRVRLKAHAPTLGALSEAELGILTDVFSRYRDRDKWSLRDATHALPEWDDPGLSSREISIKEILEVLGKTDAEIADVAWRAAEEAHFERIFSL